ncbi:hypothetical protein VPH35_140533 [Triticum aestivum]|uniref:uncharacterized protein n=1 Tax=Triticum aestivum TaxID=4565 RepID=UPI001D01605F|nr:uncharacterized protein LOC123164572 [Triticum aestivum]
MAEGSRRRRRTLMTTTADNVVRHVLVSLSMSAFFVISAAHVWQDAGHHWYNVIITAIVFLYSMVMIHLLLIKCRDRNKKSELESCQVIVISTPTDCMASVLMVAATGMLISLGVALFVFRPAWSDLAFIALMVSLSMGSTFLLLKIEDIERKKIPKGKCEDASDLVWFFF